jgi:hypothetical protein
MAPMTESGLEAAVTRAVGRRVDRLTDIRREPLDYDLFHAGRTLTRITGRAETAGGSTEWRIIEKVTEGPDKVSAYLYDNGLREFRAYESGILADLAPRVFAPHVYGQETASDGRLTLWLEDVAVDARPLSSGADIVAAARDLGRMAGRWTGSVPDHDWLFRGWLDRHGQPEAVGAAVGRLEPLRGSKEIEDRVGWRIDQAIDLIEQQAWYRDVLEGLAQTLCHHDAVGANVYRRQRDGRDETVLIDWESVGPGPIGADLASLLFASARRGDVPADLIPGVLDDALTSYADGLEEAGASVDRATLPLGLDAAIALRWTLARDVVQSIVDGTPAIRGSARTESPDEALAQLITLSRLLFDRVAEARLAAGTARTPGAARRLEQGG